MRNFFLATACFLTICLTACTGGKTAYKPTGVSLSMIKMLEGTWETVGMTVDSKTVLLAANESGDLIFTKNKMLLKALGKQELTNYSVKDKMIISDGYNGTPSGFPNICEDQNGITFRYSRFH